uniref:Exosome complex component RRP40 n=1 Tax=Amphimedon queenslandica TaxID=400682 RepID=A0A1X7UJH4_AMPQE
MDTINMGQDGPSVSILAMFLFLVVLLFTAASVTPLHQVVITEEHGLEKLICNSSFASDTVLVLSTNITHIIGNVSFCVINTTYSLTLTSDSTSKQALVKCPVQLSSGLGFDNIHNLTLKRLVVTGCGRYLRELPSNVMESINSSAHLIHHHSAAALLLLPQIKAIVIEEVKITYYYGFAMLAINPMNATINKLAVTISNGGRTNYTGWLGSGVFLLFIDIKGSQSSVPFNTFIHKSVFHYNYDYTQSYPCTSHFKDEIKYKMIYAAALTVHYRQASFIANVNIVQSNFSNNYGILVGAILLVHYNSFTYSQTTISHSSFCKNFAYSDCSIGTDLSFFFYDHNSNTNSSQMTNDCYPTGTACHFYPLLISNTAYQFTGKSGIIFIHIFSAKHFYVNVKLSRISFKFIPMFNRGSCISATSLSADTTSNYVHTCITLESVSTSNIFLSEQTESIKAYKRSSFLFTNIDCVVLNGLSNFTDNIGSVFDIRHSQVILGGQLHFENNKADTGPAFKLTGLSRFILQDDLSATFVKNSALQNYGGVIYAYNEVSSDNCMFTSNLSNSRIILVFTGVSVTPFNQVVITEEHGLEKLICNSSFASDTVLILSTNITHIIGNVSFCVVNTTYSLTLTGDSTSKQAAVKCPVQPSSGLAFDNIHNLTLNRLVVTGCGGYLRDLPSSVIESINSSVYLIHHHSAAALLLLPQIKAIVIEEVNITSYYGFAMLAINPLDTTINKLAVAISHVGRTGWLGSGVFMLFIDIKGSQSSVPFHTSIHKSVFHSNYDYTQFYPCTSDFKDEIKYKMIYAAALTVYYRQASFIANVNVVHSNFSHNCGVFVGAVLLVHYNSFTYSQTTISHSSFYENFAYGNCPIGTDLSFFFYDHNSNIDSNQMINDCYPTGLLFLINLSIDFELPLCFYDGMTELWKSGLGLLFPVYLLSIVIGLIVISRYSYVPSEGEKVIGVVLRTGRVYRVDIGASQNASLPELAFEGATKRNKPIVQVGDLVFGSLCQADPDFEPEMTCVDSSGRASGMGLLKKPGCVISCTLSLCRRLLSKQCAVMEELQKHYKFECVVGLNGRVWLSAPTLMQTIIIRNCIKSSEFMSEDSIKEMVRQAVLT